MSDNKWEWLDDSNPNYEYKDCEGIYKPNIPGVSDKLHCSRSATIKCLDCGRVFCDLHGRNVEGDSGGHKCETGEV